MASTIRLFVYEHASAGGDGDGDAVDELLAAGTSMRDALVDDFAAVDGVVVARATRAGDPAARTPRVVDVSPRQGERAAAFVSRVACTHDVTLVVAPETDGILAGMQRAIGHRRWLGCAASAIAIASSKSATRRALAARHVDVPAAWVPGKPVPANGGGWVVKPDDGAGAIATRRFARFDDARAEFERRAARGESATIESWVDGDPLSVSLLCARGRAKMLSVNRQRIDVDDTGDVRYAGVSVAAIDPHDACASALADVAHRVAEAIPGLHGFVGIDIVDHPTRGPVVIEVNPRITCAYVGLSAALGRNVAAEMLDAHLSSLRDDAFA